MSKILVPACSVDDWRRLLVDPDKQWKTGYSACALAYRWQEAGEIPCEILEALSMVPAFEALETLLVIPEHKVSLPGGNRPSQSDVWALARSKDSLVSIAVEGKVSEPFGPTIGEWLAGSTPGKEERLGFLCKELSLPCPPPPNVRYQLLHRSVSAVLEARRFLTQEAVMIVHSFSPCKSGFDDFAAFIALFGLSADIGRPARKRLDTGMTLTFVWVQGDEKYLRM